MNKKQWGLVVAGAAGYSLNRLGRGIGASRDEMRRWLPGDELIMDAMVETTHGITIEAGAAAIWPWLLQVGYGRGGWYTDSKIDELLMEHFWVKVAPVDKKPEHRPSADRILPQFQDLAVGDVVPDGPPGTVFYRVMQLVENEHLVLFSDSHHRGLPAAVLESDWIRPFSAFSWAFGLRALGPARTRLVVRARIVVRPLLFYLLFWPFLMAGEAVFPQLMLRGIKARAESMPSR